MRLVDGDELLRKWNELSVCGRTEFDQVIMCEPTVDAIIITELRKHMSDFSDLETECVPDECEGCKWLNNILHKDTNTGNIRVLPPSYKSKKEIIDDLREIMKLD